MTAREWLYRALEVERDRGWGRWLGIGLILLITVNILAVIVQSVPSIKAAYGRQFRVLEAFSVAVFTLE